MTLRPSNIPPAPYPSQLSAASFGVGHVAALLREIGEDPEREGLKETPFRFLRAFTFWTSGYGKDPAEVFKTFRDGAEGYDLPIVQTGIPIWSLCEHHLAPFFGVAHVAYIPDGKVVGLSKIPRLIEIFARRLQVQERLTVQIVDALVKHLKPKAAGVVLECRHSCMESRGVQRAEILTKTSALRGAFYDEVEARAEFFSLIKS